jgi:hypothetical protein
MALFPESSPILDELKKLDVNSMSPLEAINKLYEWQRRYGAGWGENNGLVMEQITLADLLAQVTAENLHDEVETGTAVGNQVWKSWLKRQAQGQTLPCHPQNPRRESDSLCPGLS